MGSPTWQDIIGLIKAVLSWPVVALIVLLVFREKVRGLFDRVTKVDSPIGSAEFVKALAGAESSSVGATGNVGRDGRPVQPMPPATPPYGNPPPEASPLPDQDDDDDIDWMGEEPQQQPPPPPAQPPSSLPPAPPPPAPGPQPRPSARRPRMKRRRGRLPEEWVVMAAVNPSGLVIKSWEQLSKHINRVARQQDSTIRTRSTVEESLNALLRQGFINADYVDAALKLRNARNMVAHDAQVPSNGSATAYATTAEDLRAKLVA